MGIHGFCPLCSAQIPHDRFSATFASCECGWHDKSVARTNELALEKKSIGLMFAAFVGFALICAHVLNWGAYTAQVTTAKIERSIGLLSADGYRELAQACIDLNKWSCVEETYRDLYESKNDVKALAELGNLQMRLGNTAKSVATYAVYFKHGGTDGEAMAQYGRALEAEDRSDEALKIYQASIDARPETLPIKAVSGIVRILIKRGHYLEARKRILAFHASAGNAKGYLNTELAQLNERLGNQRAIRSIASVPNRG